MSENSANSDASRALVTLLKQLIANKEYDRARSLLMRSNHPKRDEWLAKLDQVSKREQIDKLPTPWDPGWISGMVIVMTPVIASLSLAWNWRRMGKSGWALPTALSYVLIIAALIASFAVMAASGNGRLDSTTLNLPMYLILLIATFNFSYPFFMGRMQAAAYKSFKERGQLAMRSHTYRWGSNILVYIGSMLLVSLAFSMYFISQSQPRTFTDGTLSLTLPARWRDENTSAMSNCQDGQLTCHVLVTLGSYGSSQILIATVNGDAGWEAPEVYANGLWYGADADPNFTPLESGVSTINNQSAYFVKYTSTEGHFYIDYALQGPTRVLYISVSGYSEAGVEGNWAEIDVVLQSLRFANS